MLKGWPRRVSSAPRPRRRGAPRPTVRNVGAAEHLVDAHARDLFTAACIILTDRDQAASATVEAFRIAWRAPVRVACEPDRRELVRYLYLQCQRRLAADSPAPAATAAGSMTDAPDLSVEGRGRQMMARLGLLAQQQRSVLALALYGALTYRQIADLVQLPPSTVASLMHSGLRELEASRPEPTDQIAGHPSARSQ